MNFREQPEFLRGRKGEEVVAEFLQAEGWYVNATYDYSGKDGNKPPWIEGPKGDRCIIPDLDISRNGERHWVEVKAKSETTYYRKDKQYQHGIDEWSYKSYLRVKGITGTEVYLAIYEESPKVVGHPEGSNHVLGFTEDWPKLLYAPLGRLKSGRRGTSGTDRMIYWDREVFDEWKRFSIWARRN